MATLENGLQALFLENHQGFVRPAAAYIAARIGGPVP
jgi:hypothetical protein